jgi:chromodomain-helicase-DNA-binding protein 7
MGIREIEEEEPEKSKEKTEEDVTQDEVKEKRPAKTVEVEEFFVKYKDLSYLHSEWRTEEELLKCDKRISQKIKRFKLKRSQSSNIFEFVSFFIFFVFFLIN